MEKRKIKFKIIFVIIVALIEQLFIRDLLPKFMIKYKKGRVIWNF